ncbi:MAG: helix-turn-helix transcriptional regulator [Chloroflexi bacterium]|nr:MAG: helix-turn-helix transcriptional regulator [Chloroflexota bacterium]
MTWRAATDVIERERIVRGLTREQLAAAAGLDPKTVRDMLNGRRRPTLGTIGQVARVLGRPLAEVIVIAEAAAGRGTGSHERLGAKHPIQGELPLVS